MRTTLDIDDDVLQAAKELARRQRRTAGKVLSELAREGLNRPRTKRSAGKTQRASGVGGFQPFPGRGHVVSNEQIDRLREDDAY